ncbi:MAG: hypothetical protein CVU08_09605 [Bacteroidetes bacterium HGW-Bacteroidetes-3]|jgi:hypothetical protein|nr:MAG: hypothetical protein CVU08_09605 [Bacteroidetes bacterium HGW-Bacteroidetes-3]
MTDVEWEVYKEETERIFLEGIEYLNEEEKEERLRNFETLKKLDEEDRADFKRRVERIADIFRPK